MEGAEAQAIDHRMPVDARTESEAVRERFDATVLVHLDGVFRLALWLSRDRAEAEDVVQETFAQALQSFHRFEPDTNARAWLFAIMRHVRANRWRATRREPAAGDPAEEMDRFPAVEQTPQHVTEGEVLDALAVLPAGFQEVVQLCDVEELSYKEIAGVLEIPVGTVMSRLHRARRLLRAALSPYAAARGIGRRDAGGRPQGASPGERP
jgi:RNA polymerase sigma-70 factor (ECF subfamily)